jgi:hypothetical protein
MGDMYRKVTLHGVRNDGRRGGKVVVDALLDSGATSGVITVALAEAARGTIFRKFDTVEGAERDVMIAKLKAHVRDCGERGLTVIVDDELAGRAGVGPNGKPVQMILGHDYMQRTRMVLLLSDDPSEVAVVGRRGPSPRARRESKLKRHAS